MQPTILLFDVDGTIVTTGGAGRRAIVRCLEQHGIINPAQFSFAGMTDRAIVRRSLDEAGEKAGDTDIDTVLESYLDVLQQEVDQAGDEYRVHPGVVAALDAADVHPNVALGLGTGNVEAGARIKLSRVGLSERFSFGGFGCDHEDRAELIRTGAERGALKLGRTVPECRVVVIGDTTRDVAAAKANGAESFAVATGTISRDELVASTPTGVFDTLDDHGAIQRILGI